jgi:type IV secretory pathway VirB10-like protein
MSGEIPVETTEPVEEEEKYEGTPKELTGFKTAPGVTWFERKKVMIAISFSLVLIVMLGLIFSTGKSKKAKQAQGADYSYASNTSTEFLRREMERSLQQNASPGTDLPPDPSLPPDDMPEEKLLPEASIVQLNEAPPPQPAPVPQPQYDYAGPGSPPPQAVSFYSSLVPSVEGSLFGSSTAVPPPGSPVYAAAASSSQAIPGYPQGQADPYAAQNNQANKSTFYNNASSGGGVISGNYLPADILWIGTIVPAVLETAINTDLPGNVIARVTQNIYDSHTGKKLLLPQGAILIAKYNSSISYAQSRVQIVWDLLIRPDGYQLELQGMNGVDAKGMAGLKAKYHENWFEYVKAAGIISMFSVANAKMAEEAAKYASNDMAGAVVSQNAQFMNQVGGGIIGRAMNIQPTLTVESGTKINIMLNKNVYLPPMDAIPVTQKYELK